MSSSRSKPGRGGRPRLPDSARKTEQIQAWVSPDDNATIQERFEQSGLESMGEYVRQALLNGSAPATRRRADPELIAAINGLSEQTRIIGDHYNQDLKYKHLGRTVVDDDGHVKRLIIGIDQKISDTLDHVVGCDGS